MPEELIKAIYTLTKAIEKFPKGAAGSGSASSAAELIWKKQDLENIKKHSASYENRAARIEFETLFTQIQSIINKSNRLYAYDKAREESPGRYANEAAYRHIMEMKNPYASKYADYKDNFGSNTSEIIRKEFEEAFRTARNAIINPLKNIEKTYVAQFGADRGKRMSEELLEIKAKEYTLSITDPEKYREREGKRKWGKQWNNIKAAEEGAATKALADKAKLYTLSITDPEKYRDVVGREQWGEHWNDVKAAEDSKEKSRSFSIPGFGMLGKFGGALGTAVAGIEAFVGGLKLAQGTIAFQNETFIGASKYGLQMKNIADIYGINPAVSSSFLTTGMNTEQASQAAGQMNVWLQGLKYNKGWEKVSAMAMAGFDVSSIDWMNATPEQIMKTLAPQIKGADNNKIASALALGAFSPEEIKTMKSFGKEFRDLDYQEQVAIADEAWRNKIEEAKISENPSHRAWAKSMEGYGAHGYLEAGYIGVSGMERLVQEYNQSLYDRQNEALLNEGQTYLGTSAARDSGTSNSSVTKNYDIQVVIEGGIEDGNERSKGRELAEAIMMQLDSEEVIKV